MFRGFNSEGGEDYCIDISPATGMIVLLTQSAYPAPDTEHRLQHAVCLEA